MSIKKRFLWLMSNNESSIYILQREKKKKKKTEARKGTAKNTTFPLPTPLPTWGKWVVKKEAFFWFKFKKKILNFFFKT